MKKNSYKLYRRKRVNKAYLPKSTVITLNNESVPFAIRSDKVGYFHYFHYPGSVSQFSKAQEISKV